MTLEAWRYRDPSEIADELIARKKRETEQEKKHREIQRKHKHRRIAALTKIAMQNGGHNGK